jgi:citrate synthase
MVDQRGFDNQPWLTAGQAAARLGVQRRTLYAYVSRGLVRSAPGDGGRARRYVRDDVDRLATRHRARAGHGPVAAAALRWGEPVLDSAITELTAAGPSYRGHLAVELAARRISFERVAELLWSTGSAPLAAVPARWPRGAAARPGPPWSLLARLLPPGSPPSAALPLLLHAMAVRDPERHDAARPAALARARLLIPHLAAATAPDLTGAESALASPSVAGVLARALGRRDAAAVAAIDAALVLMADHELNASAFAARVAASTGADVYACLSAALAALSGPRHGAMTARVEALVEQVSAGRAAAALRERLARGESLPGFGQPIYPAGDPRALPLLALARQLAPRHARVRAALALADAAPAIAGTHATCDLGLVALASALRLPPGSPVAIFAIGRTAGWIAHILEQRDAGFLIRPRARRP